MSDYRGLEFAAMYVDAGRHDEALKILGPHLSSSPDDVNALCLASRAHLALTMPDLASDEASRAVSLAPHSVTAWQTLALARTALKDGTGAVEAAEAAIRLDPEDWASFAARATVDTNLGQVTMETFKVANRAVILNPSNADCHVVVGDVAFALRDYKLATTAYTEALRLNPLEEVARNNLAVIASNRGFTGSATGSAAATFIDMVTLDPTSPLPLHNVRATVVKATLTLHRIVWLHWGVFHVLQIPLSTGGLMGDPAVGPALRWALVATATITLLVYIRGLRRSLGHRSSTFARAFKFTRPRVTYWLGAIALVYVLLVVAAATPAPVFRFVDGACFVALCIGAIFSYRINNRTKKEAAELGISPA